MEITTMANSSGLIKRVALVVLMSMLIMSFYSRGQVQMSCDLPSLLGVGDKLILLAAKESGISSAWQEPKVIVSVFVFASNPFLGRLLTIKSRMLIASLEFVLLRLQELTLPVTSTVQSNLTILCKFSLPTDDVSVNESDLHS